MTKNFALFSKKWPQAAEIQLVKNLEREYSDSAEVRVLSAPHFLEKLGAHLAKHIAD